MSEPQPPTHPAHHRHQTNRRQSSVFKIIKRAVGDSVQVGKEAKATFTRAAGIFILYLTAW